MISLNITTLMAKDGKLNFLKIIEASNYSKDPCKVPNYLIDEINFTDFTDDSFLSYTFSIALKEKKSSPKILYVLMTIENCKNQQQTIKTELAYNEKYNIWTSKQGFMQSKECNWKLTRYRIIALNECDDEYATNDNEVVTLKSTTGGGELPARNRILARRRRA